MCDTDFCGRICEFEFEKQVKKSFNNAYRIAMLQFAVAFTEEGREPYATPEEYFANIESENYDHLFKIAMSCGASPEVVTERFELLVKEFRRAAQIGTQGLIGDADEAKT